MRRIPLIIVAFYLQILNSFSQTTVQSDSSAYKDQKLKLQEVNFVSGYYHQNGDHSAVTGGVGTELLHDIANTIDLKFSKNTPSGNIHSLDFEMGVDTYTSASSGKIRPDSTFSSNGNNGHNTLSHPSSQDTRIYPSLSYLTENVN